MRRSPYLYSIHRYPDKSNVITIHIQTYIYVTIQRNLTLFARLLEKSLDFSNKLCYTNHIPSEKG